MPKRPVDYAVRFRYLMPTKHHFAHTMDKNTACTLILLIAIAGGVVFAVHLASAQLATLDSYPPPACQHFPLSIRCVDMDQGSCLRECSDPTRLDVYASRRRTEGFLSAGIILALSHDDDGDGWGRSWHRTIYGLKMFSATMRPRTWHQERCVAACKH